MFLPRLFYKRFYTRIRINIHNNSYSYTYTSSFSSSNNNNKSLQKISDKNKLSLYSNLYTNLLSPHIDEVIRNCVRIMESEYKFAKIDNYKIIRTTLQEITKKQLSYTINKIMNEKK